MLPLSNMALDLTFRSILVWLTMMPALRWKASAKGYQSNVRGTVSILTSKL